jgi:hypothetical protein
MVMGFDLLATLKEQAEYQRYYDAQPPVACPKCGQPLQSGPPETEAVLFCSFDFWQYPRDWDPATMSGM